MAALGSSGESHAVSLPQGWEILPFSGEAVERGLPEALQAPELAKSGQRLAEVEMLVALPFDRVLPVVTAALAPIGPVQVLGTYDADKDSVVVWNLDNGRSLTLRTVPSNASTWRNCNGAHRASAYGDAVPTGCWPGTCRPPGNLRRGPQDASAAPHDNKPTEG